MHSIDKAGRRWHSKDFKRAAIEACQDPSVSLGTYDRPVAKMSLCGLPESRRYWATRHRRPLIALACAIGVWLAGLLGSGGARADAESPAPAAAIPPLSNDPAVLRSLPPVTALDHFADMVSRCRERFGWRAEILVAGAESKVWLAVYVDAHGRARGFGVIESSGVRDLDRLAMQCLAAEGRFKPDELSAGATGAWHEMRWIWRLADPPLGAWRVIPAVP